MENNRKIKILIADDHELYLDGLKSFLAGSDIYEVVGEAQNGEELVRLSLQLRPRIVLTDLRMPVMTGAVAIRKLLKASPEIKCMILTSYDNEYSIVEALEAGAVGYITKNMAKKELFEALNQVSRGLPYFCRTTTTKMVRLIAKSHFNPFIKEKQLLFTETEKKIIHMVCEEKNNQEISNKLCMSIRTVENNRARILKKMHVKTSAGVAIYAIKHGLFWMDY